MLSSNLEEKKSNTSENIKANKLNKIILALTKHIVEISNSAHEGLKTMGIALCEQMTRNMERIYEIAFTAFH